MFDYHHDTVKSMQLNDDSQWEKEKVVTLTDEQ
jgi:hypothetical protein